MNGKGKSKKNFKKTHQKVKEKRESNASEWEVRLNINVVLWGVTTTTLHHLWVQFSPTLKTQNSQRKMIPWEKRYFYQKRLLRETTLKRCGIKVDEKRGYRICEHHMWRNAAECHSQAQGKGRDINLQYGCTPRHWCQEWKENKI